MTTARKIRFALPKGNLNRPIPKNKNDKNHYRGHTRELFRLAGYDIRGYEPGEEQTHPIIPELEDKIEFLTMKPRQLPLIMARGSIDFAIVGQDSYEEWLSGLWEYADRRIKKDETMKSDGEFVFLHKNSTYSLKDKFLEIVLFGKTNNKVEDYFNNTKDFSNRFDNFVRKNNNAWCKADKYSRLMAAYNPIMARALFTEAQPQKIVGDVPKLELADLSFGKTRTIWAISKYQYDPSSISLPNIETIDSEQPWLTLREMLKIFPRNMVNLENPPYQDPINPPEGTENLRNISIYPMLSNTEVSKNLTVQCVASGQSLKKNGLVEIGNPILESTARIYRFPRKSKFIIKDKFNLLSLIENANEEEVRTYRIITPIVKRLQAASIEYGKLYGDSIHYRESKNDNQ